METILEVKDLSKTFQKGTQTIYALNQVSFTLKKGEILGIVGQSGSGKSTLVKLITRIIDTDCGSIILHGMDIATINGKKLLPFYKNIQLIFQNPISSFNPRKTIGSSIIEGMINQKIPKKQAIIKAKELLRLCQLPEDFLTKYPHQVSGGQLQRAAIARAIALEPSILICDEATSSLDVTTQKLILELLQSLQQRYQMAILFICHDLAVVQQFCHHVLVLENGSIIEKGTPYEIINEPKMDNTKKLIEAIL